MIRVAQASDPLQARLLVGVLEAQGIRACAQGEALWAARGELPFTPESAPSVWVADEADAGRARQILADHAAPPNPSRCPRCGCDLRGLPEPRCPKCATPFRKVGAWTCPACQEVIGTQFSHCWKCGAERGDLAETPPMNPPDADASAASTPCTLCGGTGRIERRLMPAALITTGAFLGFAAIHNVAELTTLAPFQNDSLFRRAAYAVVAILCFYFARQVRRTPCTCSER